MARGPLPVQGAGMAAGEGEGFPSFGLLRLAGWVTQAVWGLVVGFRWLGRKLWGRRPGVVRTARLGFATGAVLLGAGGLVQARHAYRVFALELEVATAARQAHGKGEEAVAQEVRARAHRLGWEVLAADGSNVVVRLEPGPEGLPCCRITLETEAPIRLMGWTVTRRTVRLRCSEIATPVARPAVTEVQS